MIRPRSPQTHWQHPRIVERKPGVGPDPLVAGSKGQHHELLAIRLLIKWRAVTLKVRRRPLGPVNLVAVNSVRNYFILV